MAAIAAMRLRASRISRPPYLCAVFNTIGLFDLSFIRLEGMTHGPEAVERSLARARDPLDSRVQL